MTGSERTWNVALLIVCAVAIYVIGVMVRWGVMDVQEAREGKTPFTLESALALHYGELSARSGMPELDPTVGYPEGIRPRESLNVLAPVFWGKIYSPVSVILSDKRSTSETIGKNLSLETFFHAVTAPVYCLGILALFGCVAVITGGVLLPSLGALAYALLIPSVLRSTGQEWLSENFSLPFLWTHFFFLVLALKFRANDNPNNRSFVLAIAASALSLCLAWMLWDMVQVYLLIFVATAALVLWPSFGNSSMKSISTIFLLALLATGSCDTYLRCHAAWYSLPMMLLAALFCASTFASLSGEKGVLRGMIFFMLLSVLFCFLASTQSSAKDSYNHFVTLLWYKIKFINIKPDNPALLPYEVRALWVPALHSATWGRIWNYYGPALLLWGVAMIFSTLRWLRGSLTPAGKLLLCNGLLFWFLAVLFVRMEVFWVFFAALGLAAMVPAGRIGRIIWISCFALMLIVEAKELTRQVQYLGRDVDYRALNEIVDWTKTHTPEDAVILASYALSPSFSSYAHRTIVLQPKYESALFRDKISLFEQALIAEKEDVFYSLCKTWGVRYYVHSKGFYADRSINSFRYLVGVPRPSGKTNLIKFEINPKLLNCFRLLYQNDKYLIYRVVDQTDIHKSHFCMKMASKCLAVGAPAKALHWAHRALGMNPGADEARILAVQSYGQMGNVEGARREASAMFGRMQVQRVRETAGSSPQ